MKDLPILFKAAMVRAVLAGTKTQTRRIFKLPSGTAWYCSGALRGEETGDLHDLDGPGWCSVDELSCPYGQPGDQLWVRETIYAWGRWETRYSPKKGRDEWHFVDMTLECGKAYEYPATGGQPQPMGGKRQRGGTTPAWWKRPTIHMPRRASRITLEITSVRVERLQEISIEDAKSEGAWPDVSVVGDCADYFSIDVLAVNPRRAFQMLWERINGTESWAANPWVWVVEFKRAEQLA